MIRIYSDSDSHRIRHAMHVVFEAILEMSVELVSEPEAAHVCYAQTKEGRGIHIQPSGLLQHGQMERNPEPAEWNELPAMFPSSGDVPFDIFAASFFLTTRMEEYGQIPLDRHGRFQSVDSWMGRCGVLDRPLVDEWAYALRSELKSRFAYLDFPKRRFELVSTVDVDSAYAYLGKGFARTAGGFIRDVLNGDWANFKARRACVTGAKHDPFDTYDRIQDLHSRYPVSLLWFFLLADFNRPHDISLPWQSKHLIGLIQQLAKLYPIGIHPGYYAAEDAGALGRETARLADILQGAVEHGRYHYLRGRFPQAFSGLQMVGVRYDYTVAFADAPGFRLGTCTPVPFYDLKDEVVSSVIMHPTAIMDTTLVVHSGHDPQRALERVRPLVDAVRQVDGILICLWHNETWSEYRHWEGWSDFPEEIFKLAFPAS